MSDWKMTIRAEMVRHGVAPHQLAPYYSPDHNGMVEPLRTDDIRASVKHFMYWLDAFAALKQPMSEESGE